MKNSPKMLSGCLGIALGSLITATSYTLNIKPVAAQAAYGSYIGIGPTFGLTNDDRGEGQQVGGVIAVRYKFLTVPISLRTQSLIGAGTAIVPTVSYDFPLGWQTDLYIGAGVSFASGEGIPSPLGDKTSFAIQPGIDYMIPSSNMALFGNAIIAFDAYRYNGGTAFSIQSGVGLRF
jgi:hypothetical protein